MDFGGYIFLCRPPRAAPPTFKYCVKLKNITFKAISEEAKNPKRFLPEYFDQSDFNSTEAKLKEKINELISHFYEIDQLNYDELKELVFSNHNLTDIEKHIFYKTINLTYYSQTNFNTRKVNRGIENIKHIKHDDKPTIS
jgi:hypothetical protein